MRLYDVVPYESHIFPMTRPDGMAVISLLHGGPTPEKTGYRLLELGCAGGGNLIPLAYYNPGSQFVGIDKSTVEIDQAKTASTALKIDDFGSLMRRFDEFML